MIKFWLFVLVGAAFGVLLSRDNGYVLLALGNYTVEMSLALLVLLIGALFIALYLVIQLVARSLHLGRDIADQQRRRDWQRAQQAMTRGSLEMSEGNWLSAEKQLMGGIARSKTSLPNYLAAARAAHKQGASDRRDHYLDLARESTPTAEVAVGLTQAELQLAERQLEPALATLTDLQRVAPRHPLVLRLLYSLHEQLGGWEKLRDLMPELRRNKIENATDLDLLEVRIHRALLEQAFQSGDTQQLGSAWASVPRGPRDDPELVGDFARFLQETGQSTEADKLLSTTLRKQWSTDLIEAYGLLESSEPGKKLSQLERFLDQYPHDPALLLTLGRVSLHARLWGKARGYLEACIGHGGPTQAYRELGQLLERLQEPEKAIEVYRDGLSKTGGPNPVPLPHDIGTTKANRPKLDEPALEPPSHDALPPDTEPSAST